jgi:WD40 repeat protein
MALGEHIRQRRRTRRQVSGVVTTLVVLLVAAVVAIIVAFQQRNTARAERDDALSQKVAGQALALRATDPALAAQLGLAAYRLVPTTEARGSLLSTFATPYATELTGHTSGLTRLAFSPDGHTLATASADYTVRLWDISDPHHPNALSCVLTGHKEVWSVAFSPDGRTLATASFDNIARLWDVSNPEHPSLLHTLTGHNNTVFSVAFSPDRRTLATGSADHTARLWENNVESVATQVCRITPAITQKEWDQYLPGLPYRPPCP